MNQSHQRERGGPEPLVALLMAIGLLLALPAVLLALLVYRLPRRITGRRSFWLIIAAVDSLGIVLYVLSVNHPFHVLQGQLLALCVEIVREGKLNTWNMLTLWVDIRPIWLDSLMLAPAIALFAHLRSPQPVQERLLAPQRERSAVLRAASRRAQRKMQRRYLPDQVRGQMVLGLPVQGDLHEWVMRGLFTLPAHEVSKHGIVLGASGSGKSETLLRLAVGAARVLGWQVIYIDGKGDRAAGLRFVAAMRSAGAQQVKMFPLEPYNGWVGGEEALLSRLLAVEEFSDTHYRAIAENLLRLAISAPGHPITNSAELLLRLNLTNEVLLGLYVGNPDLEAYLAYYGKRDPLGVYNRYAALLAKLQGKLDGSWSYDTVDAAYICLDGLALSSIVSGLGRYFTEDFTHYAGLRKPKERRVLFIFDELGAVDVNLTNMFERVRSCGVSVFVAGQSDHSIAYKGFLQNANRIRSAATTIILHASNHPENMIAAAGTQSVVEESSSVAGEEATGYGTARVREVPKVDPNAVRELLVGEAYVIAHGRAQRVRVAPVHVDAAFPAEAEAYIMHAAQVGQPGRASPVAQPASTPATGTTSGSDQDPSIQTAPLPKERSGDDQDEDILT